MKETIKQANWYEDKVYLYKDGNLFGTIHTTHHNDYYINEIIDNWENGILKEDNEHIENIEKA